MPLSFHRPRLRLATALVLIAGIAVVLAALVPVVKREFFPATWNTWIVRTVVRRDGAVVRVRIRRYPTHSIVYKEVIVKSEHATASRARAVGIDSGSAEPR